MKLITDKRSNNGLVNPDFNKFLLSKTENSSMTQSESDELQKILLDNIKKYPAFGLSANQLGINKRACIILNTLNSDNSDTDYLFLLNPNIINNSNEYFRFYESCLSLHNTIKKPIQTFRHTEVTVKTDNLGEITFKVNPDGDTEAQKTQFKVSLETLQTVVVQHEIDHLDGLTIKHRSTSNFNQYASASYGRNDKVIMKSPTGQFVEVKFKKANDYFLKGYELV